MVLIYKSIEINKLIYYRNKCFLKFNTQYNKAVTINESIGPLLPAARDNIKKNNIKKINLKLNIFLN